MLWLISLIGDGLSIVANLIEILNRKKEQKPSQEASIEILIKLIEIKMDAIKAELAKTDPEDLHQAAKLLREYNSMINLLRNNSMADDLIDFFPRKFSGYQTWDIIWKKPLILHDPKGEY